MIPCRRQQQSLSSAKAFYPIIAREQVCADASHLSLASLPSCWCKRGREMLPQNSRRETANTERGPRVEVCMREQTANLTSTLARLLLRMHGRRKLVSRLEDIKDAPLASPLHERLWRRRWCVPAKERERENRRPDARSKSSCCNHACSPHRSSLVITL